MAQNVETTGGRRKSVAKIKVFGVPANDEI
jgi:hypothetical protein